MLNRIGKSLESEANEAAGFHSIHKTKKYRERTKSEESHDRQLKEKEEKKLLQEKKLQEQLDK